MSGAAGGSSDMRSSHPQKDASFNLSDEHSTLQLLRAIHKSTLDPDTKNTLRDTVFAFRAEKGAVVTSELAALFAEHGFTLLSDEAVDDKTVLSKEAQTSPVSTEVAPDTRQTTLGFSRRTPQFSSGTAAAIPPADHDNVQNASIVSFAPHTVAAEDSAVESSTDTVPPSQNPDENRDAADVSNEVATKMSGGKPETSTPMSKQHSSDTDKTPNVMDRIKEIKRQVNTLVGNPVNLIDVHNEIGREYMNALLDAMKKSNGGSTQEVSDAMLRLENAFRAVQQTLTDSMSSDGNTETDTGTEEAVASTETDGTAQSAVHTKEQTPAAPETASQETDAEVSDTILKAAPTKDVAQADPPASDAVSASVEKIPDTTAVVQTATAHTQEDATDAPLSSVAKAKQIEEMRIAQKTQAASTDKQRQEAQLAQMDPLMTPQVTAGLTQLLSEWTLFKRSGLFGTGPSGIDHPLYKRLAPLTMAAVVAGRFEGVTPQIKRSIADYMNGWRYEEDIVHEQGETFEHYLRRVIKHILDKRQQHT